MSLKRGFKAEANRISLRLRRSLELLPHAPINLNRAARHFGIAIAKLTEFSAECPDAVRQLTMIDRSAFSAVTLPLDGDRRVIIHNDSHNRVRQRSNIAHELAHIILRHPFKLLIGPTGCRELDQDTEEEAAWLGSVILITDEAALHIVREGMDARTACNRYRVSAALLRMRINASGARARIARQFQ
jgi:hypothetical protein